MTASDIVYEGKLYTIKTLDPFGEPFEVRAFQHGNVWVVEIWEDVWESCPDMNEPFEISEVTAVVVYSLESNGDAHVIVYP